MPDEELRAYYNELAAAVNGKPASFEESRAQIEDLMIGKRVMDALDAWLKTARASADIRYREKVFQ